MELTIPVGVNRTITIREIEGVDSHVTIVPSLTCDPQYCLKGGEAIELVVRTGAAVLYARGALIQQAFPDMAPADRELLITGIHEECWEAMFSEE